MRLHWLHHKSLILVLKNHTAFFSCIFEHETKSPMLRHAYQLPVKVINTINITTLQGTLHTVSILHLRYKLMRKS